MMAHSFSIYNPYDGSITLHKNRYLEEPKKHEYTYIQKEYMIDDIMKNMYQRKGSPYHIVIDGFLLDKSQRKYLKELANKKAS